MKSIPIEEYGENLSRYKELLSLRPSNVNYLDKVNFYAGKIDEKEKQKAIGKLPKWSTSTGKDKMTDEQRFFAFSPSVVSVEPMNFPYNDVRSSIAVGCDSGNESWSYLTFSKQPNLTNTTNHSGFVKVDLRLKFDDQVESMEFIQTWGDKALYVEDSSLFIERIKTANKLLIELNWHGQSGVYYEYTLRNAKASIDEISTKCQI